jgi:predicted DNA-binding protein (UPF0251 family)
VRAGVGCVANKMPKARRNWAPKSKVEETMADKYRGWAIRDRMAEAVRLVMEEDLSQSEAARRCGVSRQRVNLNVQDARKVLEDQQARIEQSRLEKVALHEAVTVPRTDETVVPDLSDVPGRSEHAQEWITQERRVGTFREFNERYFGNEICPDCGVHHDTPEFHGQVMDLIEDRSRRLKLINMAPYHAKSTIATMKSTLYEICRDPSSRTALISRAGDLAQAFLYQIKQHLQDHDLYIGAAGDLIEDWGPFYNPNHWSQDQIYIAGRSGAQKDPTVSVYGFGKQIYGRRFDRMIFDDVADLENQNTPESIDKMYKKIWQEYTNRVGKTGQIMWVGTRVAPGDIYSLLDDVEGMNVLRFPCILDEDEQLTLWPDHFPYRTALEYRQAMTESQFQLVYQNVDTPGHGASFTQEAMDRSHDNDRFLGQYDPTWALVVGVDPAGANAQAGYTAMILMGVDLVSGRRHLVDIVNVKQMKSPQVIDQIIEWAERYPLREVRVEVNGLQAQLFQYNDQLNAALVSKGVRLAPHITHKGNKWDPQFGVESMASLYHNGMISTPWADANARKKFKELEAQLLQFPMGTVTDLVMAMWFAELGCRDIKKRSEISPFDNRRRVPRRIGRRRAVVDFGEGKVRSPTELEMKASWLGGAPHIDPVRYVNVPGEVR